MQLYLDQLPKLKPILPTQDPAYARMRSLAEESDKFTPVLDEFSAVIRKNGGVPTRARTALLEAYATYGATQQQLAVATALAGRFAEMEQHLQHAHTGYDLPEISLCLKPTITPEATKTILELGLTITPLDYFMTRVITAAHAGNVKDIKRSIAFCVQACEKQGLVEIPPAESLREKIGLEVGANGEVTINLKDKKYDSFFALQYDLSKLHNQAYGIAIRNRIEVAIGHAVLKNTSWEYVDRQTISRLGKEVKELLEEALQRPENDSDQKFVVTSNDGKRINVEAMVGSNDRTMYLERISRDVFDPLFVELAKCRSDGKHPLREMYAATFGSTIIQQGELWSQISGSNKIKVETTATILTSFYRRLITETGLPLFVHPFFEPVAEMYGFMNTDIITKS